MRKRVHQLLLLEGSFIVCGCLPRIHDDDFSKIKREGTMMKEITQDQKNVSSINR